MSPLNAIGVSPPPIFDEKVEDLTLTTTTTTVPKGKKSPAPQLVIDNDGLEDTPMHK